MERDDIVLLEKVVQTAKEYFSNQEDREKFEKNLEETLEDDQSFC